MTVGESPMNDLELLLVFYCHLLDNAPINVGPPPGTYGAMDGDLSLFT